MTPREALSFVRHPYTACVNLETARLALSALDDDAEIERKQRHHDVLCLVLKASYERWSDHSEPYIHQFNAVAKMAADLAYPPPKAEP